MDNRRYSLARYSVNQAEKELAVAERFSAVLGALAGASVPVDIKGRHGETLRGAVRGTVSVISAFSGREDLGAAAHGSANVLLSAAFTEALQSKAYGQKNTPAALLLLEGVSQSAWASKSLPVSLDVEDRLSARVEGSKDIVTALGGWEVLTSVMEATTQTIEQAVFQLTIPPGGELRIDSDLFTVLLNGENALHTQSGDWISLSRELLRLSIESATGGELEGQMIYTERYL